METIDQYGYRFRIDRERTRTAYEKRPSAGSWLRDALPEAVHLAEQAAAPERT